MNIKDLPFFDRLFEMGEAMQYAFGEDGKKPSKYWLDVLSGTKREAVYKRIQQVKQDYAAELEESPILCGILDVYRLAYETNNIDAWKVFYQSFQDFQKEYDFDSHKKAYFDAGCILYNDDDLEVSDGKTDIAVLYPIFLYASHVAKGGISDEHRYGYLGPIHRLTKEELDEIYAINPKLFKGKVKEKYENMASGSQTPSNQ